MVTRPPAAADPTAARRRCPWRPWRGVGLPARARRQRRWAQRVLTTGAHSYGICWFEQRADGQWQQHVIDHSWSHARVGACRRQRQPPGPRVREAFQARNAPAPGTTTRWAFINARFTRGEGRGDVDAPHHRLRQQGRWRPSDGGAGHRRRRRRGRRQRRKVRTVPRRQPSKQRARSPRSASRHR